MKFALLMTMILSLSACIGSGQNTSVTKVDDGFIPSMAGIDLLGEERPIPDSFKGDLNIVTFAFEREQQEMVNTWIDGLEPILENEVNVRYYEIPLIYEMNAVMRGWVNNGMRAGIPDEAARERTITVYTDRDKFLKMMSMDTTTIYTVLVDQKGKILWRTDGVATDEKIKTLQGLL